MTTSQQTSPLPPIPLNLLDEEVMPTQPICTPVDQPILHRDATIQTPGRSAIKRRRTTFHSAFHSGGALDYVHAKQTAIGKPSTRVDPCSQLSGGDDELRFGTSQSQRADLPDMSQDTLTLFPGLVREHVVGRRKDFGGYSAKTRKAGEGSMRRSLARASLMSTLSGAKSMTNPFLSKQGDTFDRNEVNGKEVDGIGKVVGASSESFHDLGGILEGEERSVFSPFVLPTGTVDFGEPKEGGGPMDTLRVLLVSSNTQGRKFSLDFECIREAGKGAFSEVFQARHHLDGCSYAIKRNVNPLISNGQRMDALQEVFALSALQPHPNILSYNDAWFEDQGKFLYIQTEFLAEGSLYDGYVKGKKRMPTHELWALAADMSSALTYMHRKGIVHLDVKPDNIFRTCRGQAQKSYIIGDFGLACHEDGKDARSTEGDARYLCPEALSNLTDGEPTLGHGEQLGSPFAIHSQAAKTNSGLSKVDVLDLKARDVFALGASLYELATAVPLEMSGDEWQDFRRDTAKAAKAVEDICQSRDLARLVEKCLDVESKKRATAGELLRMCEENIQVTSKTSCTFEKLKREVDMWKGEAEKLKRQKNELMAVVSKFDRATTRILTSGEKHRKRYRETCGERSKLHSGVVTR